MHLGDVWTPTRNVYFLNQPALVDRVLVEEADKYPKSISMGSMLELLMGTGVFVSNGELWRKQRRMLDPAFNHARIQDVFPLMRIATEAMVARLRTHAETSADRRRRRRTLPPQHHFHHILARLTADESRRIFRAFSRFQELAYAAGRLADGRRAAVAFPRPRLCARHARIIRRLLENGIRNGSKSRRRARAGSTRISLLRC
jgi:cytochrome P450